MITLETILARLLSLTDEEVISLLHAVSNENYKRWSRVSEELVAQGIASLTNEEKKLILGGQYLQAIKEVRQRMGVGLKEAKAIVDGVNKSTIIINEPVDESKSREAHADKYL